MRVLMVCLGNICRSPMAEAVLAAQAPTWTVDSAGTASYHIGQEPDPRTISELARHGLRTRHRGRQVTAADFTRFDLILAMDRLNLRNLERVRPKDATAQLTLLGAYDPQGIDEVPDPYEEDAAAFAAIHVQIARSCAALVSGRPAAAGPRTRPA